jgi:ATP-dependent Clp protease adaptor protein ClpS
VAAAVTETLTPTRSPVESDVDGALGPPWNVVVLNDDHNTFEGVAFALASTIPGVDYARGRAIADTIHNSGRAVVWSGHREAAESYWERLGASGLTMAPLEPGG